MNAPLLEPEQYKLLAQFVQASRGEFLVTHPHNQAEPTFIHRITNERFQGSETDAKILVSYRFLIRSDGCYAVTPAGIAYQNEVIASKMMCGEND